MRTNLDLNKHRRKSNSAIRKAAAKGKSGSSNYAKAVFPVIAALVICAALFMELNSRFFKIEGIPTWEEVFKTAELAQSSEKVEGDLTVHFIDVGQGDCELVMSGTKSVLIDSGEKSYYSRVINYLKNQKVTRLDYVIVTHPHSDHAGGMSYILKEFDVGALIMPKLSEKITPTTSTYYNLLKTIESQNIALQYAEPNKTYQLDGASIKILSPLNDYNDLNNYSVAVKLVHGENSFLFTGDMEREAEADLLASGADISARVLKVGHHGSSTSTSKDFLDKVNPQYAVIEVGSPNDYGHPHSQVMKRLENKNIEIYRTDLNGNIVFVSDGRIFDILKEENKNADN